jgi:L-threonylcarbamoyladenylate synthase
VGGPVIRIPFRTPDEHTAALDRVARHVQRGGLIAGPTETVYGFGGRVDDDALERLAQLKQRDPAKSFLLLVTDAAMLPDVDWTPAAVTLADAFWPGPLTLALSAGSGSLPQRVVSPRGTVAIRATSHAGMRLLLERLREPLTSTSANAPGGAPARSADQVVALLEATPRTEEMIVLDGGTLPASASSTIVDCSVEPPRVLRAGAITTAELMERIHGFELDDGVRT